MFRTILFAIAVGLAVCLPPGRSPRPATRDAVSIVDQLMSPPKHDNRRRAEDHRRQRPAPTKDEGDTILVEMDMKMSKKYYDYLHGKTKIDPRKGLRDDKFRWTNNKIPYTIDSFFEDWEKQAMRKAMDEWEKYTCLKFVPRTNEKDYVNIISGSGCWSMVGMNGQKQEISLDVNGCIYHHTIVHELGHTVGFHHEQTRPDRDTYVQVLTQNIQSGQERNFDKYDTKLIDYFGVNYDYWSVMHYSAYAFSGTGGKTIQTLDKSFEEVIGSVPGLSFKDIQAANKMYKCDKHCTNQCPAKAIRSKDCKCWCNNLNPGDPVVEWDGVSECKGGDDFTDACTDYHQTCPQWASEGECDANPSYMLINCRKSCQLCGDNAICKDFNKNCEYWRVIGECSANPGFMTLHCRKSCEVCGGPAPTLGPCDDRYDDVCKGAAGYGDCEMYPASMLWECALSCKVCGDDAICRNWDILCPTWKEMGECTANPEWMNRHCARACGQCQGEDVPDCKNYVLDGDCDYWAGTGECVTNPGFMLYKCAKSCRVCGSNKDCLNYSPNCQYWKGQNLCVDDKPGMNFYCPLACGLCTGDGLDKPDCENHDFNCERWEQGGECDANPLFMLFYCPRSCRVCGDDQVCKNFHPQCQEWADDGECQSNPGYMELHCRPACGLCTPSGGSSTTPRPGGTTTPGRTTTTTKRTTTPGDGSKPAGCTDELPEDCKDDIGHLDDCIRWKAEGKCTSFPDASEMWRLCQKTCQMCGEDMICRDHNAGCEDWGNTGQCEANPGYMYIFCRESCNCC